MSLPAAYPRCWYCADLGRSSDYVQYSCMDSRPSTWSSQQLFSSTQISPYRSILPRSPAFTPPESPTQYLPPHPILPTTYHTATTYEYQQPLTQSEQQLSFQEVEQQQPLHETIQRPLLVPFIDYYPIFPIDVPNEQPTLNASSGGIFSDPIEPVTVSSPYKILEQLQDDYIDEYKEPGTYRRDPEYVRAAGGFAPEEYTEDDADGEVEEFVPVFAVPALPVRPTVENRKKPPRTPARRKRAVVKKEEISDEPPAKRKVAAKENKDVIKKEKQSLESRGEMLLRRLPKINY